MIKKGTIATVIGLSPLLFFTIKSVAFANDKKMSKEPTKKIEKEYKCQGMVEAYKQEIKLFSDGSYEGNDVLVYPGGTHRKSKISGDYNTIFAMGLRPQAEITELTNPKEGRANIIRRNTITKGSLKSVASLKKGQKTRLEFIRSNEDIKTGDNPGIKYSYDFQIMDETKAFSEVTGKIDAVEIRSKRKLLNKHPNPKVEEDSCETTGVFSKKYGWIKYTMVDFINDEIVADETCILTKYKEMNI